RLVLAAERGRNQPRLAAVLRWGILGVHGCRLVLAIGLFLGVGALPLWAVASASTLRVGLDARHCLGAGMGHLAQLGRLLRLGPVATASRVRSGIRVAI